MSEPRVHFMHPTDGRIITVTLDPTITVGETIAELIANDFVSPIPMGYNLAVKGGPLLRHNQTFAEAEVRSGDTIRVIPATDAGGLPGFDHRTLKNLSLDDISRSPEALTIFVRMYENLEKQHRRMSAELESERLKSQSRLTAALILLVSQVILSIGTNLLTSDAAGGGAVLIAGGLMALLAIYLTFKNPRERRSTKSEEKRGWPANTPADRTLGSASNPKLR